MPFIVPNSEVILYSNIKITDGEQIAFPSLSSQTAYFTRHIVTRVQNCSYIRKTGYVRLEVPTSTVSGCNYLSFKNASFENKTIYARILNWEYVNNVTTDVLYAIDWFQTFCFDVEYENAYIMREHLSSADYVKAQQNPFNPDIYEFQTAEKLPVGPTLEDLPCVGNTATIVGQESSDDDICIVMFIADFNTEAISQDYIDFLTIFSSGYVIKPDGTVIPDTLDPPKRIPRAYGVYCLRAGSTQLEKFADALDWLAIHDLTHQVIGVYAIPESYITAYMSNGQFSLNESVAPLSYNVVNKKLLLAPYQYVRVYNNEGDIKEFQYENFATIRTATTLGNKSGIFYFVLSLDGAPMISLMPQQYGVTVGNSEDAYSELNINERIDINNILQIGYSSDAFLTYLSSQYSKIVGNRTTFQEDYDSNRYMADTVDIGLEAADSVKSFAGGDFGGGLAKANQSFRDVSELGYDFARNYEAPKLIEEARKTGASNYEIDRVFGNSKRTYIANEYHAGSTNGALPFYVGFALNPNWYLIVQVKLKNSVLAVYDRFFSMYGYTSNRIAVPKVCNYIKGSSDADIIPHFDTEVESTGTTYCCTKNMHVISPMSVVSTYIENLFNTGCRFHKGDNLS